MGISGLIQEPWPHVELGEIIDPLAMRILCKRWPTDGWSKIECNGTRRIQRVDHVWPELAKELLSSDTEELLCNVLHVKQKPLYPFALLVDDLPGYRIRSHTDCAGKVITCQIYLGDGPDTQGVVLHGGGKEKQIPYRFNCGYAFKVTKHSWHKVNECKEPRRSIQLLYYDTPNPKF